MTRAKATAAETAGMASAVRMLAAEREAYRTTVGLVAWQREQERRRAARTTATRARVAAVLAARSAGHQLNLLDQGDHYA